MLNQAGVQYSTLIAEVTDRALGKQMKASESTRNGGGSAQEVEGGVSGEEEVYLL